MNLNGRITRLERSRGPRACPACGGGGLVVLKIPAPEVAGPDGIGRDDGGPRPGDFCGTCGRKRVLRVAAPRLRGAAA